MTAELKRMRLLVPVVPQTRRVKTLAVARLRGVGVHFLRRAATLEFVGLLHCRDWQLVLLSDGHWADFQLLGKHAVDDEAAGNPTCNRRRFHIAVAAHKLIDEHAEDEHAETHAGRPAAA